MAEVKDYYPGDLETAREQAMAWMLSRLNANVSPFNGNALATPTTVAFAEGAINLTSSRYDDYAQE